ncbi:MAG: (2Fe-2S)-binding protein [Deltaproteobacteria bacterium]|nr:MAG: (2Fe-2S)-binding protein [Deltaproteobacteria bacterium]
MRIKTIAPGAKVATAASQPEEKPVNKKSEAHQAARQKPVSRSVKSDPQNNGDLSDEILEDIVNRVVERFNQLKGIVPVKAVKKQSGTVKTEHAPADDDDLILCRCEEITKGEIKEAIRNGMRTLNGIKRITRAGMGLCQGQTCQRLVTQILAQELGLSPAEVEPTTARGPVRPLRLEVFANR